jgi:hypothetical protein
MPYSLRETAENSSSSFHRTSEALDRHAPRAHDENVSADLGGPDLFQDALEIAAKYSFNVGI